MTIQFLYRCRRCDDIFESTAIFGSHAVGLSDGHLLNCVMGREPSQPMAPRLLNIHHCPQGGRGIADLIGWEERKS